MREEVTKFIEAYRDSFSHGSSAIAEFYSESCVTARMVVVRVNRTRNDTELLFVEVDTRYRRGFTHGPHRRPALFRMRMRAAAFYPFSRPRTASRHSRD